MSERAILVRLLRHWAAARTIGALLILMALPLDSVPVTVTNIDPGPAAKFCGSQVGVRHWMLKVTLAKAPGASCVAELGNVTVRVCAPAGTPKVMFSWN